MPGISLEQHDKKIRRLTAYGYPFFNTTPSVNTVVYDSNDENCDQAYGSPPIYEETLPGFPRDGTEQLRKRWMACGVAPARFMFTTSDLPAYEDTSITANMEVKIVCARAKFINGQTCESLLDATNNFPTPKSNEGCNFYEREASIILATRLRPRTSYSITLKLLMPPGVNTASENSFDLKIRYYQLQTVEGTMAPVDIIATVPNAKNTNVPESVIAGAGYGDGFAGTEARGYITRFTWEPPASNLYLSAVGITRTFRFGIRTFGVINIGETQGFDIVAHPTDIWRFGTPGNLCNGWENGVLTACECHYKSFPGAPAEESNGFRITTTNTKLDNIGSRTDVEAIFSLTLTNPSVPVNMYWIATSFKETTNDILVQPFTVFLDKPISVLGEPQGAIVNWQMGSISAEQWVTLEITSTGNTIMPDTTTGDSGMIVIIPPRSFTVVSSATPLEADGNYNPLPCATWPESDRVLGRWVCTLEDRAPFQDTTYRVQLYVRNPSEPGAAQAWRLEFWQTGLDKPVAVTRSVRGMPVSGTMEASFSPNNQLLGATNELLFDFTPSRDIGPQRDARLQVIAPAGFIIIKRCQGFNPVQVPPCTCRGSDANSFYLTFTEEDAIKGGVTYKFSLEVTNPTQNVPEYENFWGFDTVRPDGITRDTTRYQSFFLFPSQFASLMVAPESRRTGQQFVVIRFRSNERIPHDDYLSFRAPLLVRWAAQNLGFESSSTATNAADLYTYVPIVEPDAPHIMVVKLAQETQADIEYGIRARCNVPPDTPVPNRWWLEQSRQTGLTDPPWQYIASMGTTGFDTQVLIETAVEPFNIQQEGWQNPTVVAFKATSDVLPYTESTVLGDVEVLPEFLLRAPPGFTYVCPLQPTLPGYMPQYAVPVPNNVECYVNHNDESVRNELRIVFPTGIMAYTRYVFTIDVVNGQLPQDPVDNYFHLATRINGQMVEDVTVDGYILGRRMDNTRFYPDPRGPFTHTILAHEDRRVEAMENTVNFILGTTEAFSGDTVLEIRAPIGFEFNYDCTNDVGQSEVLLGTTGMETLPSITACMNQELAAVPMPSIARIHMTGPWIQGEYGLEALVKNPAVTPLRNFWGFTIERTDTGEPLMTEARVLGFDIQEVLNPRFVAYGAGNSEPGEAALNQVDFSFELTTHLPADQTYRSQIRLTAPPGFRFPAVCQKFTPDTGNPAARPFPDDTDCQGDNGRTLILTLPAMMPMFNNSRYEFRFLVINPDETFIDTDMPSRWWVVETQYQGQIVDQHRRVPSFPLYQRLQYFNVDTLSYVGLNSTTFRIMFQTTSPLPPQHTVSIHPPQGTIFQGVLGVGACKEPDEDAALIARRFNAPLISDVMPLPEWVSCQVISPNEVLLTNAEPVLGGRSLLTDSVYYVFVKNSTNAEETPELNIFSIVARTTTEFGQEVWFNDGWVIFPELRMTSVESSNPGYGLYTSFTIRLQTVNPVESGGSVRIIAPLDNYFGPTDWPGLVREFPIDELNPRPPPQGMLPQRPPNGQVIDCEVLRPTDWQCPLAFAPCIELDRIELMETRGFQLTATQVSQKNTYQQECQDWVERCNRETEPLSNLIQCTSHATADGVILDLTLLPGVSLPAKYIFRFMVNGYNARQPAVSPEYNAWHFMTRDGTTDKTVLDEKRGVPGLTLMGIIAVDQINPTDTKVGSIENSVTMTITLTDNVDPPAILRITHPIVYLRTANAGTSGIAIDLGPNFPSQVQKQQLVNQIQLTAVDAVIPANLPLDITLILSNPHISPQPQENIWTFETFSTFSGSEERINCNLNVRGFMVFGEFSEANVIATVLSPVAETIIGIWFMLKSPLTEDPSSRFKVWMPRSWRPLPGPDQISCADFSRTYNGNREGVSNQWQLPGGNEFVEMVSGTECAIGYDATAGLHFIILTRIEIEVDDGLDFAFEFGAQNPQYNLPPAENVWRFETYQNDVILHLARDIPGYELEQIELVALSPRITTSLERMNRMTFEMMSNKYIQGGSTIRIRAPVGFSFNCAFFSTDEGLSSTTTCLPSVINPEVVEFTIDSQDPKEPYTPWKIYCYVANPEFTPQNNYWTFEIENFLEVIIDRRDFVPSFDITDKVQVDIYSRHPYIGELNPLRIQFVPTTIMNQADNGNELMITAPLNQGYRFPGNCSGFSIRVSGDISAYSAILAFFPPPGITCTGYNPPNESATIRLPDGVGLPISNYTIEIDVTNPSYAPNETNPRWTFITRVRDPAIGQRIVDENTTVAGFALYEMLPTKSKETAAAQHRAPVYGGMLSLLLFCSYAVASPLRGDREGVR